MNTIYESHSINNAHSIENVVEIVNNGTCEGIEGIEFSSDMLAGCYIFNAAAEGGYGFGEDELEAHCEILADAGANFNKVGAISYAKKLAEAIN
tara:strand:- start:717 stop:998 length:282 start_codon:yes stop_codon:yes gene_type:complete